MRSILASLLTALSVHALPELSISKRDRHNNGATSVFARSVGLDKRQDTIASNIFNVPSWTNGGGYYTNVSVGTPPQLQTVLIDTGSSDLYFDASSAATCKKTTGRKSCQGGSFDRSKSSTYKELDALPGFNVTFGDGSTAFGPYGKDVIGIGDIFVSPVQFGVAEEVDSTTGPAIGMLGLGYDTNEAARSGSDLYTNLPGVLAASDEISSKLYSVYLNDANADTGTILFGGIDRTKYTGDLVTLNLIPAMYPQGLSDAVNHFITTVTGASAKVQGRRTTLWSGAEDGISAYTQSSDALPVLLDTGSTPWFIPQSVYDQYIDPVFTYVDSNQLCSCEHASSDDSLTLEFGGKIAIEVPAHSFIVPVINTTTRESVPYDDNNDLCRLLIEPTSSVNRFYQPLGDAILRSMYIVFDLDNGQVSIAQANVNSTDTPDIVKVEAGPDGVANAVGGSSVQTAAENTWMIAPEGPEATADFSVVTAASPLGTATGVGAIPAAAQVKESGSATNIRIKGKELKGAAPSKGMGALEWSVLCGLAVWAAAFGAGFGLVV